MKYFVFECDICRTKTTVKSASVDIPRGWAQVRVHVDQEDFVTQHLCEICTKNIGDFSRSHATITENVDPNPQA